MGKRAQRIPSWPGVIHSNKGRIHSRRPTCGILRFRFAAKRRTIHSGNPTHFPRTHLNTILGYAQDFLGRIGAVSGFLFGFCVWTRRHRLDAALQTIRHHEHQLCLPVFLVPLGGGHPERLFAKSEPAQNRWDAPIARNLSSELDCAGRSSLTAKIHFFSTDVTRCFALCKVRLLPRDFPSITVRWACK